MTIVNDIAVVDVLLIERAENLSSIGGNGDRLIMSSTADVLRRDGHVVSETSEEHVHNFLLKQGRDLPSLILSMGRSPEILEWLRCAENAGVRVINTPKSIRRCSRKYLHTALLRHGLLPEGNENKGFWVKAGNTSGVHAGNVQYHASYTEAIKAIRLLDRSGYDDCVITSHIEGEVIKFYGVGDNVYFAVFDSDKHCLSLPIDQLKQLQHQVCVLIKDIGLEVYGGDAVITHEGSVHVIDLNDWPSFSCCSLEASEAIGRYIKREMKDE